MTLFTDWLRKRDELGELTHFPPDEAFLRSAIWSLLGIPPDRLDELLDALGVTRRELWIELVRRF